MVETEVETKGLTNGGTIDRFSFQQVGLRFTEETSTVAARELFLPVLLPEAGAKSRSAERVVLEAVKIDSDVCLFFGIEGLKDFRSEKMVA